MFRCSPFSLWHTMGQSPSANCNCQAAEALCPPHSPGKSWINACWIHFAQGAILEINMTSFKSPKASRNHVNQRESTGNQEESTDQPDTWLRSFQTRAWQCLLEAIRSQRIPVQEALRMSGTDWTLYTVCGITASTRNSQHPLRQSALFWINILIQGCCNNRNLLLDSWDTSITIYDFEPSFFALSGAVGRLFETIYCWFL